MEDAIMIDSVNKQKSDIIMDTSVTKEKKMGARDILLVPQPTNDTLDPLV